MKATGRKFGIMTAVLAAMLAITTGCGGSKADVSAFLMFAQNAPFDEQDKLEQSLQQKLGEAPTVDISISPLFDLQKLVVELAGGEHGIYVLPKEQFQGFMKDEGFLPLNDPFDANEFPEAVHNGSLYGVPLQDSAWLKEAGYSGGGEVYGFILLRYKQPDKAKQVLQAMAER